jgi:hypothetical protein
VGDGGCSLTNLWKNKLHPSDFSNDLEFFDFLYCSVHKIAGVGWFDVALSREKIGAD